MIVQKHCQKARLPAWTRVATHRHSNIDGASALLLQVAIVILPEKGTVLVDRKGRY